MDQLYCFTAALHVDQLYCFTAGADPHVDPDPHVDLKIYMSFTAKPAASQQDAAVKLM